MKMNSNVVNKRIREIIRPILKANGFTKFTARDSWRHQNDRIDVINFQSFNAYDADGLGCTTFSFSVNLGCLFNYIPKQQPLKEKSGLILPKEYECHFRSHLKKGFLQKKGIIRNQYKRGDIWFIDKDGANLDEVIDDAKSQVESTGLAWFDQFDSPSEVLRILTEEDENMDLLWGFGRNPSPIRSYLTGYVAMHLNQEDLAIRSFEKSIDSGCFKELFNSVDDAMSRIL